MTAFNSTTTCISDNKVGSSRSHYNAIIKNRLLHLPTEIDSSPFQLNSEAPLINNSTFAVAERREKEGFYSGEWIDPTPAFGLNIQAKLVLNFGKALRFSLIGDRSE